MARVIFVLNALGMDHAAAFLGLTRNLLPRYVRGCYEISSTKSEYDERLRVRLESMTVRELRDLVKTLPDLNKRGTMSRLKLKKDIVEYLRGNLRSSVSENLVQADKAMQSLPIMMPAAKETVPTMSAKEATFERTYQQYPPLRAMEWVSGVGEDDIRQKYHPIFEGDQNQQTGDMDIVFVGTASCTPGTTRGVSCTAVRLNWNRQAIHGVPGGREDSERGFNGGTWLFDAGECTQVRSLVGDPFFLIFG